MTNVFHFHLCRLNFRIEQFPCKASINQIKTSDNTNHRPSILLVTCPHEVLWMKVIDMESLFHCSRIVKCTDEQRVEYLHSVNCNQIRILDLRVKTVIGCLKER